MNERVRNDRSGAAARTPRAVVIVAALLAVSACPARTIQDGKCQSDAECGQFRKCALPEGVCKCTADDGCDASEFCNVAGSCQAFQECIEDTDCSKNGAASICDTRQPLVNAGDPTDSVHSSTSGQCVTLNATDTQCLLDSHCPFGFYCSSQKCVPGCKDDGDCPLGQPCISNQCDPTPGACDAPGYCEFGQLCTSQDFCQDHRDRPTLCQHCRGDDPNQTTCSVCLIDPAVPAPTCTSDSQCSAGYCVHFQCLSDNDCPPPETCDGGDIFTPGTCHGHCGDFFCGNDTCNDQSDPCPRGYNCFELIVVGRNTCTRGGGQCQQGSVCSADLPGELNENGSCSCLSDGDCPGFGITCVNPGPQGACVQGNTCGPEAGFTCADLR